jgi:hypothetical protein
MLECAKPEHGAILGDQKKVLENTQQAMENIRQYDLRYGQS